jgi:hypothetical protein
MNELIESARRTFRKLAVFEVDAKKSAAADSNWDRTKELLAAADVIDDLFWQQGSPKMDYRSLLEQMGEDDELREMFLFNRGPYDRFNNNEPFLHIELESPGKGFYPSDLTREEFIAYLREHRDLASSFESPYTLITRSNSHLTAVPYHVAYREMVNRLSRLLVQASTLEEHRGFSRFLAQRAKDILVDDYYASETLWVTLEDNSLDLVIGPYEVYEDGLMGLKASYEAIMFERDFDESAKIKHVQRDLVSLCERVEEELGRPLQVQDTPVKLTIANLVYASGEARKAVPAIAFSLPNDERVIEEVGSRQVILKNVIEAKFNLVAQRITSHVLDVPLGNEKAAFQDFFSHTLFHEISHSLGPQRIVVNSDATTVNRCLKQYHSVLEEAKADALGACLALNADRDLDSNLFLRGYIGRFIRSIRFGLDQAHGGANAIQFNYLLHEKAFTVNLERGRLSLNESRARKAVFKLASNIIDIQERGDFAAADKFLSRFCVASPEIEALAERVKDFPIDIRIRYVDWNS